MLSFLLSVVDGDEGVAEGDEGVAEGELAEPEAEPEAEPDAEPVAPPEDGGVVLLLEAGGVVLLLGAGEDEDGLLDVLEPFLESSPQAASANAAAAAMSTVLIMDWVL